MKKSIKKLILIVIIFCVFVIFWLYFYLVYWLSSNHPFIDEYWESNYYLSSTKSWNKYNFIFYPWAFVSAEAYLPLSSCLAQNGINTYIAKMPLFFPLLDINAANRIIKTFSGWFYGKIAVWWHSLGGVAAAKYILTNNWADKLILLWSYSVDTISWIKTLSLIWEKDWLATYDKIMDASWFLDKNTTKYILLTWANHSQFWRYWLQRWDNEADISPEKQLQLVCNNISLRLKNNN